MKKTDRKIAMYSKDMGWNFVRVIYVDESGGRFIKINGSYVDLYWCEGQCDHYYEDFAKEF